MSIRSQWDKLVEILKTKIDALAILLKNNDNFKNRCARQTEVEMSTAKFSFCNEYLVISHRRIYLEIINCQTYICCSFLNMENKANMTYDKISFILYIIW